MTTLLARCNEPHVRPACGSSERHSGCPMRTDPAVDSFRAVQNVTEAGSIAGAASPNDSMRTDHGRTVQISTHFTTQRLVTVGAVGRAVARLTTEPTVASAGGRRCGLFATKADKEDGMQSPRIARTAHERVTDVLTYVDQMLDDAIAEPHELREYHRRKREALATTSAADALDALSMGLRRGTSPRHINDLATMARRAMDELPESAA